MKERKKKNTWLRLALIIIGAAFVAVILLGFILTRPSILSKIVVPKLEAATGLKVQLRRIALNPFGRLQIDEIATRTPDDRPLLMIRQLLIRFSPLSLLSGSYRLSEITITEPTLLLQREADGRGNWELLATSTNRTVPKEKQAPSRPFQIDQLRITNATLVYRDLADVAGPVEVVLTNLTLSADQIKTEQIKQATCRLQWMINRNGATPFELAGSGKADLAVVLGKNAVPPQHARLELNAQISRATGELKKLEQLAAELTLLTSSNRIEQAALSFHQGTNKLGQLSLSGVYAPDGSTGRFSYQITNLTEEALNFLGAAFGVVFSGTRLQADGAVDMSQRGKNLTATVNLKMEHFQARRGRFSIPTINLTLSTETQLDIDDRRGRVRSLELEINQNGQPLLTAQLERAMNIFWDLRQYQRELMASARGEAVTLDSILRFRLHNLRLDEWTAFLGENQLQGTVSVNGSLTNSLLGARISLGAETHAKGLKVPLPQVQLADLDLDGRFVFTLDQLRLLLINSYSVAARHREQPLLNIQGSGSVDIQTLDTQLELLADVPIPQLVNLIPFQQLAATSGTAKLQGIVRYETLQKGGDLTVTIDRFTGQWQDLALTNYSCTVEIGGEYSTELANLRKFSFRQGSGSLDLSGQYHFREQRGQFRYNAAGLDLVSAVPWLNRSIQPYVVQRLILDGTGAFTVTASRALTLNGTIGASELLINRVGLTNSLSPMRLTLELDLSYAANLLKLGTNVIQLEPTQRADNRITITGTVDLSRTNPAPSILKLSANRLELTKLYDDVRTLLETQGPQPERHQASSPSGPVRLPISNATLEWMIQRIYLHDLDIMQCHGIARLQNTRLIVDPCQMLINGGSASLRLITDITDPASTLQLSWSVEEVPIDPLLRTFGSGAVQRIGGLLISHGTLNAAGKTNLLASLSGTTDLILTNLQLRLMPPFVSRIITPLATALQATELLSSYPQAFATKVSLQNGTAVVEQARLISPLLVAETSGQIKLGSSLLQTAVRLPLNLAVSSNLVQRLGLKQLKPSAWPGFAELPPLLQVSGTLSNLKGVLNEKGLTGLLLERVAPALPEEAREAAGVLSKVLGGDGSQSDSTRTNAPVNQATNLIPNLRSLQKLLPK